jgi:dihydrofolate reductase
MRLSLIWAMAENRVIGKDGGLPWHLPDELRHFLRTTRGHTLVMGRRTFESIGSKPLAGRRTIVVTRNSALRSTGVEVAADLDEALRLAHADEEVFVAGGAALYAQALPRADRLVATLVHADLDGDVEFPDVDWAAWRLVSDERHEADDGHPYAFSIRVYERA